MSPERLSKQYLGRRKLKNSSFFLGPLKISDYSPLDLVPTRKGGYEYLITINQDHKDKGKVWWVA